MNRATANRAAQIRKASAELSDEQLLAYLDSQYSTNFQDSFLSAQNPEDNNLRFLKLPIIGSYRTVCARYHDDRGFFQETFHVKKYFENRVIDGKNNAEVENSKSSPLFGNGTSQKFSPWLQKSWSRSRKHVFRGLHTSKYGKLVTCVRGAIYDVMVDLREDSKTFLRWQGVLLTEQNRRQIFVPSGIGHGFFTLGEVNDAVYLQEGTFNPPEERDVHWQDPDIGIPWDAIFRRFCGNVAPPTNLILSKKDKVARSIRVSAPHLESFLEQQKRSLGKRMLVIGGSGQVGSAMLEEFKAFGYQVLGTHFSAGPDAMNNCDTEGLVYFDMEAAGKLRQKNGNFSGRNELCDALMELFMPSVVVICAGFTWVDGCEASEEKANLLNAYGPAEVTLAAQRIGARTVYLSSEYVFNGSTNSPGPYSESSPANPVNVYGQSKLLGEQLVVETDPKALVLRTTVVYGPDPRGKNFVYQLVRRLGKVSSSINEIATTAAEGMNVVTDQVSSPTYSRDVARATRLLLDKEASGVFNVVGPDSIDRHKFALCVAQVLGLDTSKLKGISTAEMKQVAKRPLAAGLLVDKLKLATGFTPRKCGDALNHWLKNPRSNSSDANRSVGEFAMPLFGSGNTSKNMNA
eukprot:g6192.t1